MQANEIQDFIERAPPIWRYESIGHMANYSQVRKQWLFEIASGSIHDRINRRSGYKVSSNPFYAPLRGPYASIKRHKRRLLQIAGNRSLCHIWS